MCNAGKLDRIIRVALGASIITWGVLNNNWMGAIGAIPLLTGAFGWCPLYSLIGINTGCRK